MPTPIYHITHINNLPSILNSKGLIACSRLRQQQANYTNIAYEQIQDRRARKQVPCGARGVLHDYVPFYFAPRSPMLYTIHRGNNITKLPISAFCEKISSVVLLMIKYK